MEKEITDILVEKKFHELDPSEKDQLKDLCESEEDYEQMRNLFLGLSVMKKDSMTPKAETKKSLDDIFAEVHGKRDRVIWYNSMLAVIYPTEKKFHQRPLVQVAALLVVIVLLIPFFNNDDIIKNNVKQVAVEDVKKEVSGSEKEPSIIETTETIPEIETNLNEQTASTVKLPDLMANSISGEMSGAVSAFDVEDLSFGEMTSTVQPIASKAVFDHPDGVFKGGAANFSVTTADNPEVLDLITAVF